MNLLSKLNEQLIIEKLSQSPKLQEILETFFASNDSEKIMNDANKYVLLLMKSIHQSQEEIKKEQEEVESGQRNIQDTFVYKQVKQMMPFKIDGLAFPNKDEMFAMLLPEVPEIENLDPNTFSRLAAEASKGLIAQKFGFKF